MYPRAPRVIAYCDDAGVLGAPFYLMERRRGVILRRELPAWPRRRAHPRTCATSSSTRSSISTRSTTRAAGLGDFGKPDGYVERQVTGWTERYAGSQTDDIAAMTDGRRVARRAHAAVDGARVADPQRLQVRQRRLRSGRSSTIIGVLDWEMATIGDPLMDLGTALSYWVEATDPQVFQMPMLRRPTKPGMLTRADCAQRYFERSGRRTDDLVFFYAFGLFKTAVIAPADLLPVREGAHAGPAVRAVHPRGAGTWRSGAAVDR